MGQSEVEFKGVYLWKFLFHTSRCQRKFLEVESSDVIQKNFFKKYSTTIYQERLKNLYGIIWCSFEREHVVAYE